MTKSIMCILVLVGLAIQISCKDFSTFGMRKSSDVFLSEFAEKVNSVLGTIGYLQCYDVSEKISIFPVNPVITLSNIEIAELKTLTGVAKEQLEFTSDKVDGLVKAKGSKLVLNATINLKWTYAVGGAIIYRGKFAGHLRGNNSDIAFKLLGGKPDFTGSIAFTWKVSNHKIEGFGATEFIAEQIESIIASKLYPVLHEEMNRYNDIIVASLVYNSFYRNLPIPIKTPLNEDVSMKNVFKKFNFAKEGYITFVYDSSIYYAIQHIEVPFNGSFDASDASDEPISLFFGLASMEEVLNRIVEVSPFKSFTITPEVQKEFFGYEITIGLLGMFFNDLPTRYSSMQKTDFKCDMKTNVPSSQKTFSYTCYFTFPGKPSEIFVHLSNVDWKADFSISVLPSDPNKKTLKCGLTNFKFANIIAFEPPLPDYLREQLLTFLQPLAKYPGESLYFEVPAVGPKMNWEFSNNVMGKEEAYIYYKLK